MVDAAFAGAGKTAGMELWRIEKLAPVKQSVVNGKFHVGDSYILLVTTQKNNALTWAIHFWLGAETSQDEAGVAAYKTVELDESLGGGPVQYREVQGNESQLFLSYFKKTGGIEYLPGGVESGFRKVERDVFPTRLLQLKGKRTVRVNEVPLSKNSLNKGDVFILDAGFKIYVFDGPDANKNEKAKGLEVAAHINSDERGSRAEIILLHEDPTNAEFWGHFGGFVKPESLPAGEDDAATESKSVRKLFRISDASGSISFDEVSDASGKLNKSMLDGNDVFLLHSPSDKIFLWIGKKANLNEKKEATARAVQYIQSHGLPKSTAVERVTEGGETGSFKSEFALWDPPKSFGMAPKASTASETPVDVAALMARKATEDAPVDDGSGKLKVWVIKDFNKEEVPAEQYGHFYGGDSYILLYSYMKGRNEEHIIYFWLGTESTPDEKGAAALLTVQLDDSMGGKPVQVRVTQGKEPAHFRQLFKGNMVIYKGGYTKGGAGPVVDDIALFHIRGTNALNTVAVQVTAQASSLNSEDSFVLVTPSNVYVWQGGSANKDELAVATNVGNTLAGRYQNKSGRLVSTVSEGGEPEEFWSALGGQAEYSRLSPGEPAPRDPRLFSASTATGTFRVEEVDNFDQSDLNDEDVYLLDTYTQLFVWIGSQSSQTEKEKAMEFAHKYIAEADDGRDLDMPIIRVTAGQEPAMFGSHFLGWDPEYTKKRVFVDPYQAKLDAMAVQKGKTSADAPASSHAAPADTYKSPVRPTSTGASTATPSATKPHNFSVPQTAPATSPAPAAPLPPVSGEHDYESLKSGVPDGVDPTRKEEYLSDANFQTVFGMDKKTFMAQPKWKRDEAKKKKGLF